MVALVLATAIPVFIYGFIIGDDLPVLVPILTPIVVGSGVVIAMITFERQGKINQEERNRNHSKVFLGRVIAGFDEVENLLKDQNNDRVIWIHAARTLLRAQDLGAKINSPEYKTVFELEVDRTRAKLNQILSFDEGDGNKIPLPPQFFFGQKNWKEDWKNKTSLHKLAIETKGSGMKVWSPDISELPPQFKTGPIAEKSIVAIYTFLEYEEDFSDLLEPIELWNTNWMSTWVGNEQGARQYIAHREKYYADDGKLFEAGTGDEVKVDP